MKNQTLYLSLKKKMEKSILIKHPLQDSSSMATVPFRYQVIKEGNKTTINCRVNLPEDKMPEWLNIREFSIPSVYMEGSPGVTATYFSEVKGCNAETALFLDSVHKQIRLAEKWSERYQ